MSDGRSEGLGDTGGVVAASGSPFAPGSPFLEYLRPPRIGIIHLLAWTAVMAVLLKLNVAVEMVGDTGGESAPVGYDVFRRVLQIAGWMAIAAGLVGAGILLRAKIAGVPGRLQPGHWLVLLDALVSVLSLHLWVVYTVASAGEWFGAVNLSSLYLAAYGLLGIVLAGLYLGVMFRCRDGRRWRVCMGTLGASCLIQGLSYLAGALWWWSGEVPLLTETLGVVFLAVVVLDLRRGPRRDWLHWLGVVIVGVGMVIALAWRLCVRLI